MARVKIDIERKKGEINKNIFGGFIEHLGRCIYGGIYDPKSKNSDKEGYRNDVIDAIKKLGISVLRWPGGNFASGYHWKDGIGKKEERPFRFDLAWKKLETNEFGTDEFIKLCKKINCEPYIVVNCGSGDINEAIEWLEYCNGKEKTFWAEKRRKNSSFEPYNVKYWGIGNEVDGFWQIGHKSADEYGKTALEFAKVMKWFDPSIKIIASGSSDWEKDWGINWDYKICKYLSEWTDYIGIHLYVGNRERDFKKYMGISEVIEKRIENTANAIKTALAEIKSKRRIYIAFDEWNVYYRSSEKDGLEEIYNFEDALVAGIFLNSFIRNSEIVKMANLAQLVNVIAPIRVIKDKIVLQTIFYPFEEFSKRTRGDSLDIFFEGEDYETENRYLGKFRTSYLDISSCFDGEKIFLNVINKSEKENFYLEGELQNENFKEISGVEITADSKEVEDSSEIRKEKIKKIQFKGKFFKIKIKPLSLNFFEII
jgi:alpha-N-arabinofuranosidase